jgi:hypothetical protein
MANANETPCGDPIAASRVWGPIPDATRIKIEAAITRRESILALCKALELEGEANISEGGFAESQTRELRQYSGQLDELAHEIAAIGTETPANEGGA